MKSDFALLDVKTGRGALNKHFAKAPRGRECPVAMRVPVTITGYIDGIWGSGDGVFSVTVESVKTGKARSR